MRWAICVVVSLLFFPCFAFADSISIESATVATGASKIDAKGYFVATSIVVYRWEVSTDSGKTWNRCGDTTVFEFMGGTWQGTSSSLANGTYWLRLYMETPNGKYTSNVVKNLTVPGP